MKEEKKTYKAKTLADVKPMKEAELKEALENKLSPFIYDAIKDRLDTIPVHLQEALVQKIRLPRRAMIDFQIPFNRHQQREIALEALYQHLLLDKDIRKSLYDALLGSNAVNGYLYSLTVGTVENEEHYKEILKPYLREDWEFERLSLLEQAILLMSCQEILENETPKSVAINEAVTLAKEYCDDPSPKLINGILDNLPDLSKSDKQAKKEEEEKSQPVPEQDEEKKVAQESLQPVSSSDEDQEK